MSAYNNNSSQENGADNALLNTSTTDGGIQPGGRQSPPTYVRDYTTTTGGSESPLRERNIPIHLSDQPALLSPSPLTRTRTPVISPSSPTEREPFLPLRSTTPAVVPDYDGDRSASSHHPRNNLTLVRDDMTDAEVALPDRTGWRYKLARVTHISNPLLREGLAEFLGSFILIIFGNGAVAEVVLSAKTGAVNNFFSINIAYGLAVAFGVYIAGGVSGGHINPAVSLGMAVLGKLQWRKLGIYFLAQYLGCFVASAVLYAIYADAFYAHDGGYRITNPAHPNATAGIFASYPQEHLTWGGGLVDQIFATSFLMIGILALTDERNTAPPKGVVPILVGLLVTAIGLSYGFNCGFPVNPARDLGPRLFTLIGGWGVEPFSFRNHNWFWIPVIGPHLGALLGVAVYQLFIGNQWPPLQRSGIELQVVRKNGLDEYELVKSRDVRGSDLTVPVAISTKDGTTQRLLETR